MAVTTVQIISRMKGPCMDDFIRMRSGENILQETSNFVKEYRGREMPFKVTFHSKPRDVVLEIGDLENTAYAGRKHMLDSWKHLYLDKSTELEVLGVLNGLPCLAPWLQFIILVAEDGVVYAYENEVLHKIAENAIQLFEGKGVIPGKKVYRYGKGFMPTATEENLRMVKGIQLNKSILKSQNYADSKADKFRMLLDLLN
uniref:15.5 kDa protein n=1 Tax=Callorhinchus milii TaxID=7868 RepID=V9KZW9_CALMI